MGKSEIKGAYNEPSELAMGALYTLSLIFTIVLLVVLLFHFTDENIRWRKIAQENIANT